MYIPHNKDTLQKFSLIAFSQAILAIMDDEREVVGFYPTELIIPTFRKKLMDGVLELSDGTLMDIEFQTGDLKEKFLLRCAQYAINLRVISGKLVETNIISTGSRFKSKKIAFISKFFPFKPKLFFYSEFDGLEKLINVKKKIEIKEKLTLLDCYNLVFIPLMGNVDRVKVAFEVFHIADNSKLFSEDIQSEIKKCQYVVAQIVADGDEKLLKEFWEVIKMNNELLMKFEKLLVEEKTIEIARNLKEVASDEEIAQCTGLPLEKVKQL